MDIIKKKYAIIFSGNLSNYFSSLSIIKQMCEIYDIDIYILYSKNINYIHTGLFGENKNFNINNDDLNLIRSEIGKNIKYLQCIEDLNNYKNILNKYIEIFKTNIKWIKTHKRQMNRFNYEDFMDNERTRNYIDQFVRTYYLYNVIKETEINYDYIIKLRIDILYPLDFMHKIFDKINNNTIPCLYLLDCIYIIEKSHFNFYNYLLNHFGTFPEKASNDTYYLGPEPQFDSIVYSFFEKKDIHKIPFRLSFSVFDNNIIYTYKNKDNPALVYSKFCKDENINLTNYKEKFNNNNNIIISSNKINISQKYRDNLLLIYTIL